MSNGCQRCQRDGSFDILLTFRAWESKGKRVKRTVPLTMRIICFVINIFNV